MNDVNSYRGLNPQPQRVVAIDFMPLVDADPNSNPVEVERPAASYKLFTGSSTPASDLGSIGDWYFRISGNLIVYQKILAGWVQVTIV